MENNKNIYQRVLDVMREVTTVYKDTKVNMGKNSYAAVSHDAITKLLHMPMVNAGIVSIPSTESHELTIIDTVNKYDGAVQKVYCSKVRAKVIFVNADNPEDRFEVFNEGIGLDFSDKSIGKAYSYAIKYAYLKVFLLESSENDEERIEINSTKNIKNGFQRQDHQNQSSQIIQNNFPNVPKKGHATGAIIKPIVSSNPTKLPLKIFGICPSCESFLHHSPNTGLTFCANYKNCTLKPFEGKDEIELPDEIAQRNNKEEIKKFYESIKSSLWGKV